MDTASNTVYVGRRTILPPPAPGTSSENAPPPTNPRTRASAKKMTTPIKPRTSTSAKQTSTLRKPTIRASTQQTPTPREPRTRAPAKQTPTPRNPRASAPVPSNRTPVATKPENDPKVARVFSADVHQRRVSPFFIRLSFTIYSPPLFSS